MIKILFITLIGIIFSIYLFNNVNAGAIYHNDNIPTSYAEGDKITGKFNITLENVDFDSIVRTNFNQEITLRSLLEINGFKLGYNYNCSTYNCLSSYTKNSIITSTNLAESKLVGFSLQGNNVESVQELKLDIQGSTSASCFADLLLDVLDKDEKIIGSSKYLLDSSCYPPRYGCFETGRNDYQLAIIPFDKEYCEKITLPSAPAFRLGARVVNSTQGSSSLRMKLYKTDGTFLQECTLPSLTSQIQTTACTLPYASAVQRDYFVCIRAVSPSNHKIRIETNAPCGTNDFGISYGADYEVFARNLKFNIPKIELNSGSFVNFTGDDLNEYVNEFISKNYGNACNPYCVIPLEIKGVQQQLTFSNAKVVYTSSAGQLENNNIYSISKVSPSVSSNGLNINIGLANFTIPDEVIEDRLIIEIGSEKIIDKEIDISQGFNFNLEPRFAAFGINTQFTIVSDENITQAQWNFGDGSPIGTTAGKTTSHRYNNQGTFTLEARATSSSGAVSTKRFDIVVGNPKESANATLLQYQRQFSDVTRNISNFPAWIQAPIKKQLNYDEVNKSLREIAIDYNFAVNDSDYIKIMSRLIELNAPSQITSGVAGNVPLLIGAENIDVNAIEIISDSDIEDDEALRDAIAAYIRDNYNAEINFEKIDVVYADNSVETILTKFKIKTNPKITNENENYLVIGYPKNEMVFAEDYKVKDADSSTYIALENENQVFEFAILDSVAAEELGAYISPKTDYLEISEIECNYNDECDEGENKENCSDCKGRAGTAVFLIILILVLGAIAFFVGRRWYKKSYEGSLFKNKADLNNLMTFIKNVSRAGTNDNEIKEKLRASGWKDEQIKYAFSKIKKERKVY